MYSVTKKLLGECKSQPQTGSVVAMGNHSASPYIRAKQMQIPQNDLVLISIALTCIVCWNPQGFSFQVDTVSNCETSVQLYSTAIHIFFNQIANS